MGNSVDLVTENYKEVAVKYLKSIGLNLQEKQIEQFIEICSLYGLNPFKREIYAVGFGANFNIIVGYEVYIKKAELTGLLNGWRAWVEGEGENMRGCVEIHRKDFENVFYHEVYREEYDTKKALWATKPITMIKKVAIAQGFRMCFCRDLGGIPYTESEIEVQVEEVKKQEEKPKNRSRELYLILKQKGLSMEQIKEFSETYQLSNEKNVEYMIENIDFLEFKIRSMLGKEGL